MNVEALVQTAVKQQLAVDAAQPQGGRAVASEAPAQAAAPAQPVAHAPIEAPSFDAVKAAAAQIDSYLKSVGRNLDIHVDNDTGLMVVKVRDSETGDVIRQIPSEEALRLARSLGESGAALVNLTA